MDYEVSDSSGTDDDLPPSHQNRFHRGGRSAGNERSGVAGSVPFPGMHNDMETQIHHIEQEAYCSVLRAFKAQSDAITWDKESLITELRKELRVSDEEHRELLMRVDADNVIRNISEWRKVSGLQTSMRTSTQLVQELLPTPNISASRKKHKTSQYVPSLSAGAAPPSVDANLQPSSLAFRRGSASGTRGKKSHPSTGLTRRVPNANQTSAGAFDPLIGRKVWTRWPEDNSFYEAVITDCKEGRHALVYDINTANETWEWVDLKEISPEDIRWEGEDPAISHRGGCGGPGRGMKKSMGRGGATAGIGRGRGIVKCPSRKGFTPSQNGVGKHRSKDIEILHTDTLIKEVEKVFSSNHPDTMEIEKAKAVLKDHEQALVDAIARLEDASDNESDEGETQLSEGQSDHERGWRKGEYDGMVGDGRPIDRRDGERAGRDDRVAFDDNQDDGADI